MSRHGGVAVKSTVLAGNFGGSWLITFSIGKKIAIPFLKQTFVSFIDQKTMDASIGKLS